MTTERVVLYTNKPVFQQAIKEYAERKQIEAMIVIPFIVVSIKLIFIIYF